MNNLEILIPIFGIVAVFGTPTAITALVLRFDNQASERFHQTLKSLIEKEQPITPELLRSIPGHKEENGQNDVRKGVIISSSGIGLILFGIFGVDERALWGIGLMVTVIGVAILGYGLYRQAKG